MRQTSALLRTQEVVMEFQAEQLGNARQVVVFSAQAFPLKVVSRHFAMP